MNPSYEADIHLPSYGPLTFTKIQWYQSSRMVLLRYAIDGTEMPLGLRMDIDKKAILDFPDGYDNLGQTICDDSENIWNEVVKRMNDLRLEHAADQLYAIGRLHGWFEGPSPSNWRDLDPIGREEFLDVTWEIIKAYNEHG